MFTSTKEVSNFFSFKWLATNLDPIPNEIPSCNMFIMVLLYFSTIKINYNLGCMAFCFHIHINKHSILKMLELLYFNEDNTWQNLLKLNVTHINIRLKKIIYSLLSQIMYSFCTFFLVWNMEKTECQSI